MNLVWLIGGILQLVAAWFALVHGMSWTFVPLFGVALAGAFLAPEVGVILLVGSWFIRVPILGMPAVFPADIVMMVLIAGDWCRQLSAGRRLIEPTPLNLAIGLWMIVYAVSLMNAVDLATGIKNWLRHGSMFLLFFTMVRNLDSTRVRRTLVVFVALCAIISVGNVAVFLWQRGAVRAFGIAGNPFSGFLALVATLAASMALLERHAARRRLWTMLLLLFLAGQMANQSRGAMLQLISGVVFVLAVGMRWSRRHSPRHIRPRLLVVSSALVLAAVVAWATAGASFQRVLTRYASQGGNPAFTLQTRAVLWASAARAFWQHPVIGIGPAQVRDIDSYLPELRFDPIYWHARRLGTHNAILQYLAESGLVGSLLLAWLLWRALSLGRRIIHDTPDPDAAKWQIGIWGAVFVIVSRYLYEGHLFYSIAGMSTVTFIAMLHTVRSSSAPPVQDV